MRQNNPPVCGERSELGIFFACGAPQPSAVAPRLALPRTCSFPSVTKTYKGTGHRGVSWTYIGVERHRWWAPWAVDGNWGHGAAWVAFATGCPAAARVGGGGGGPRRCRPPLGRCAGRRQRSPPRTRHAPRNSAATVASPIPGAAARHGRHAEHTPWLLLASAARAAPGASSPGVCARGAPRHRRERGSAGVVRGQVRAGKAGAHLPCAGRVTGRARRCLAPAKKTPTRQAAPPQRRAVEP